MLNYDEIVTRTNDHRAFLLANAAQQRLAQSLTLDQPHPIIAWIGQRLIHWGEQLQSVKAQPPTSATTTSSLHA
ncbi:MAG: hypothetical protein R3C14_48500 [Caldilineaceae bacterium]